MFRRKDNETTPGGETRTEAPLARPVAETKPMPQTAEAPRRGVDPAAAPAAAASTDSGGKRLMVGQGISLAGEITSCDRLIVEGDVQVTLNETRAIEIAESGRFTNGKASVEDAEISGIYEGELTVSGRLLIRATGRVKGTVRYGELELERGGRISGTISMIDER